MMLLAVVFLYLCVGKDILECCISKTQKDMRKPQAIADAPDYEAAMILLKQIRSPPFSGCAHTLECKAVLWGNIWAIPFIRRQFIFPVEGNDPFIVGGQGDTVRKQGLEGDQRLETEQAATSHIGLLSSFDVYFLGVPPAAACAANNAAQHCWARRALCPAPAAPGGRCPLPVPSATAAASPALSCHTDSVCPAQLCCIVASQCVPD